MKVLSAPSSYAIMPGLTASARTEKQSNFISSSEQPSFSGNGTIKPSFVKLFSAFLALSSIVLPVKGLFAQEKTEPSSEVTETKEASPAYLAAKNAVTKAENQVIKFHLRNIQERWIPYLKEFKQAAMDNYANCLSTKQKDMLDGFINELEKSANNQEITVKAIDALESGIPTEEQRNALRKCDLDLWSAFIITETVRNYFEPKGIEVDKQKLPFPDKFFLQNDFTKEWDTAKETLRTAVKSFKEQNGEFKSVWGLNKGFFDLSEYNNLDYQWDKGL